MREQRQQEAVEAFLSHKDRKTIINACPRFGKIKVAIDILKAQGYTHPGILMPRVDIEHGWVSDIEKFHYTGTPTFYTFRSIKKVSKWTHDIYIIDEPHELSVNQQNELADVIPEHIDVLGLTGTMTQKTRDELYNSLNLDVCYKYTIDQGVREGILADYDIILHKVALDDSRYTFKTKAKSYTEQGWFNLQEYLKKEAKDSRSKHMFNLKMINILQNSVAKMEETRRLIKQYEGDRLLVFCGVTEVADRLGISVYHSKKKEEEVFKNFCNGVGDHLATIKMMQAGITVTPIHKGIINYMSGNPEDSAQKICRFLGLEYANLDKRAEIHIVCSKEDFELSRLRTGLLFFDEKKIKNV